MLFMKTERKIWYIIEQMSVKGQIMYSKMNFKILLLQFRSY